MYKVMQPNGKLYTLYYEKEITTEEKIEILNKTLLSFWDDYIITKWLYFGKFDMFHRNHEDKVKMLLERCSSFLLLGELNHEGFWIADKKRKKIRAIEQPISSSSTKTIDSFYSNGNDTTIDYKPEQKNNNEYQEEYISKIRKEQNNKKVRSYKVEYKRKSKRKESIHSQIDYNKFYTSEWVSIDTQNNFMFDGFKFEIDGRNKSYQGQLLTSGDVFYEQDKVLCFCQNNKYYFFDMEFNQIFDTKKLEF